MKSGEFMKKIFILLFGLFIMTGCSVVRIDTNSIDNIVDVVLSKNNTLYNRIGRGYKYYKPRGVSYIDTLDLNDVLYSNGDYYYLYIDAIGYYYKAKIDIKENKDAYYFKKIKLKDKEGYLEITKQSNGYHIEFVYNYAKIETVVDEDKIDEVVLNSSYILSTVKFNDNIIGLMLDDEYFTNKEERYTLFEQKEENNNFLEYIEEQ